MAKLGVERTLAIVAVLIVGWSSSARAQVVQNCQPDQYVDRTAPGADRQLTWDFGIASDPERCMQVRVGQTVVWDVVGSFDLHPLAGQGGDMPNPITSHQNGSVTFTSPGTFGFVCLNHSTMKGAIRVVPAPALVPAATPWWIAALTALLLASGWLVLRRGAAPARASGGT
jgi:plastocyanin